MSTVNRKHYSIAIAAAESIRRFWRNHKDSHMYCKPEIIVRPITYEIVSNIKNGYPPMVGA